MNIEANRLETFNDWPSDAAVSPTRIAKAGFFYTKHNLTVKCFACDATISEWSYGDQAMAKHRSINPQCPFVLEWESSDVANVANDLRSEEVRLRTFWNWPASHIVTPETLAKAGLYSIQESDLTKCWCCKGVIGAWEAGDQPDIEHKRLFPQCPFVQQIINPRVDSVSNLNINIVNDGSLTELGVNTHKVPKSAKYITLEARLASFRTWPDDLVQTPDSLAQAGFFYEGAGDQVRCFHCDGGLMHWDPHDEPWTEHARWFPNCGFVQLIKGADFIVACAPQLDAATTKELETNKRFIPHDHHHHHSTHHNRKEISEREIQNHMLQPSALAALSIGLQEGRVKQAIRDKLTRTGVGFASGDALIEATLNLQRDEEDNSSGGEQDARIARTVTHALHEELERALTQRRREEEEDDSADASTATATARTTTATTTTRVALAASASDRHSMSLEEENRLLKEARLCKICMDGEVGIVFLPCGHLATCVNCAPNLHDCPVCRSAIKATVRTFLS